MLWSDTPATTVPTPVETPTPVEIPAATEDEAAEAGTEEAPAEVGPAPDVAAEPELLAVDPAATSDAPDVAADEAFLAEMAAEFDAIQAALARLDDGSFDRCQVCGGRIGEERLMADPLVTRCAAHA